MASPTMPEYEKISDEELRELSIEAGRELTPAQAYEYLHRKRVEAALAFMLDPEPKP